MKIQFFTLLTAVFFSTLSYAADSTTKNLPSENQQLYPSEQKRDISSRTIIAEEEALRSDPRWYKTRAGRKEYLKGGSDYPGRPDQYSTSDEYPAHHQTSPNNDSRWYKTRSGRQEYLKGNNAPGRPSQYLENGDYSEYQRTSPGSHPRRV